MIVGDRTRNLFGARKVLRHATTASLDPHTRREVVVLVVWACIPYTVQK